jgi:hypothetical protein
MNLPFGLDLISILVGMAVAWFVIPWVLTMFNRPSRSAAAA